MEYLTTVLVRMTLKKAVLSELRSHPHGGHQLQGLLRQYQNPAAGFQLPQSGYRYSMGICRSITKSIHQSEEHKHKAKWAPHLLTDWEHDPALVLSRSKISLGLQRKTINPFLIVLSRGTGNLLHSPGWSIYIGSSTKGTKVPWTNL